MAPRSRRTPDAFPRLRKRRLRLPRFGFRRNGQNYVLVSLQLLG